MLLIFISLISSPVWPDTIPELHLDFEQSQWEYACDNYWADIYVPAQLTFNGFSYDCQFRIRGASSRSFPKKSIKVELVEGTYIFGHDELNLNAEYLDWTKLRECLSYMYLDHIGQVVPEVHLVEVVFNGETQGAYLSVEDVDADFLLNTNLPDEAVIYKCTDRYTTLDRVDELGPYTKKTHEFQPWDDFLLLLYWLRLCPEEIFREQLQERFYYSDLLSSVAANVLLGNGSTYYHNYLLILDATGGTGRWRYMAWDMDRTWWKYGPEFSYHKNSSNNGNRRNTLIWRMWCNATIRDELFAEMQRQYPLILDFSSDNTIDSLASLIAPLVEVDPFRDYTMDQFWNEVENLDNWPEARYSNVLNQINQWPLPFRIRIGEQENASGDITISWQNAGNQCSWRLAISPDSLFSNPDKVLYEAFPSDTFHTVPAVYTGSDLWLQVYATRNGVEQRSDNGPILSVYRDHYAISGNLMINEINYMSSPQFDPGDWFEVINTDDQPLCLEGWSVRDNNRTNLTTLGDLTIQPEQCLVFCSDSFAFINVFETIPDPSWWLNFNLSDSGDDLLLIDPVGNTVDSVSYLPEDPWPWQAGGHGATLALVDTSLPNQYPSSWEAGPFGGTPFSADNWCSDWPRHGAVSFSLTGPVPLNGDLSILLTAIAPVVVEVCLYDLSGRVILTPDILELEAGVSSFTLKTGTLPSGVYLVGVRNMGFIQTAKITVLGTR
ncbi:MAG: CotH kinase family protein [Candidatus Sabulitectum sp.]|nr:CotH kinase family protein [Candidatus Sabulitectum sp.]